MLFISVVVIEKIMVICVRIVWGFTITNGGTKHRKVLGGGTAFFKWLRDNNYPKEYRILCMNCNFSIGHFGYCPHKKVDE